MDVQNQFSHLLVTSFEILVASTQFLGALVSFSDAEIFKLPIVPVVIYDYSSIFNKKNKLFETGIIKVEVLKPIPTDGTTPDDVSVITENVRQVMLKVFHEHDHTGNENDASSIDDKKIN